MATLAGSVLEIVEGAPEVRLMAGTATTADRAANPGERVSAGRVDS